MKQNITKKSGKHTALYDNGNVKATGFMKNGELEGYWEWFRKDGSKMRSGHFKASKQIGEWITYDHESKVYKKTKFPSKKESLEKKR